jgi:hypothetical protein
MTSGECTWKLTTAAEQIDTTAPADKQIEQILAIAPILPGQKASAAPKVNTAPPAQPSQPAQPAQAAEPDLVDFGQNDGAAAPPPTSVPAGAGGSMQEPLQPSNSQPSSSLPRGAVKRMDTDVDGEEDVFVDAES